MRSPQYWNTDRADNEDRPLRAYVATISVYLKASSPVAAEIALNEMNKIRDRAWNGHRLHELNEVKKPSRPCPLSARERTGRSRPRPSPPRTWPS